MSNGELVARAQQRVGDLEREAAVERLRTAVGEGRLTLDELDGRLESALAARTYGDLDALTADLPDTRPAPLHPERESVRLAVRHGHIERLGRWQIPPLVDLDLAHAVAALDLRTSPLPPNGLRIHIEARHSQIQLLVNEGTMVETDELGRHHAAISDRRGRRVAEWSGPPVVVFGALRHSTLKIKRPR
ncbi:MAG TPA: DUF1707 domain-containing protein [Actinocrinis sp.]|nr:DUF1707 domain-containing protein [Actinocrinis sp.]